MDPEITVQQVVQVAPILREQRPVQAQCFFAATTAPELANARDDKTVARGFRRYHPTDDEGNCDDAEEQNWHRCDPKTNVLEHISKPQPSGMVTIILQLRRRSSCQ
jgi:hypothetical protein